MSEKKKAKTKKKKVDHDLLRRLTDQQTNPFRGKRSDAQAEADADYADNEWRNEAQG